MKKKPFTMELDEIITNRRSIRRFKPNPLTKEQIEAILDAGNKAPSAKNLQHWRFHVYMGEAKDKLVEFCLKEFDRIAKDPDEVHPYARYSFQIMEEAPVSVLIYSANVMGHPCRPDIQSISAAIQNMLLKAYELGLGSLWICDILYIDKAVMKYAKTDMPLIAAISFGYANESPNDRRRLTLEDVTTWYE
jgi:nitroreductase